MIIIEEAGNGVAAQIAAVYSICIFRLIMESVGVSTHLLLPQTLCFPGNGGPASVVSVIELFTVDMPKL